MRNIACLLARIGCAAALVLLAALTGGASPSEAQTPTLAELARKEAERRKLQKPAGKVYTNKDVPAPQGRPATPAPQALAPAEATAPAADPGAQQLSAGDPKDESYWKGRIAQAREELRRNESFAEALQSRINTLTRDFTSRDNPAQRAKVADDRDRALAEMARVKSEVERNRKLIEGIEDEARRAGVPPGWLR